MLHEITALCARTLWKKLFGPFFVLLYFTPQFFVNFLRFRKLHFKVCVLSLKNNYLRFKVRHSLFMNRLLKEQPFAENCRNGNVFKYVCDYAHDVILSPFTQRRVERFGIGLASLLAKSEDECARTILFRCANQRTSEQIGRGAKRNSPFRRAQRAGTTNKGK